MSLFSARYFVKGLRDVCNKIERHSVAYIHMSESMGDHRLQHESVDSRMRPVLYHAHWPSIAAWGRQYRSVKMRYTGITHNNCSQTENVKEFTIQKRQFYLGCTLYKQLDQMEVKNAVQNLTDKFMEARELLQDARESEGTTYFSDDMQDAQQAVAETIEEYGQLLSKLTEEQRRDVMRTIGLKMEELKAQLQAMEQELKEEH